MMEKVVIKKVKTKQDFAKSIQIRTVVFVSEQNVPLEREVDKYENVTENFLAFVNGVALATIRYREIKNATVKVERLAVLKQARKLGLGFKLMNFVIKEAKKQKYEKIKLSAQDYTVGFYEKLGFKIVGDSYLDANIKHYDMYLSL